MKILLACALLLAGCSDLPPLTEGECGNLVIDRGEDCDGEPTCDRQCRLRCDDGVCATEGYTCGVDNVCRAPSGVFGEATGTLSLSTSKFEVTDIDKNGIRDVISMSPTSVSVNFGDPTGKLLVQTSTLTPTVQGPPLFANLDVGDSLDLILPTEDGIVAYSSPQGVLAPHPFSIDLANTSPLCTMQLGIPFHVFPADDRHLAVVFLIPPAMPGGTGGRVGLAIIDAQGKDSCPSQPPQVLCSNVASVNQTWIDTYDITDAATPTRRRTMVVATTPQGLCAMEVHADAPATPQRFTLSAVTSSPYPQVIGRPILADLNDSGCPSVIDSHAGGLQMQLYAGSKTASGCSIATASTPLQRAFGFSPPELTNQAAAVGRVALLPRIPGMAPDALVMGSGVYAVNATTRRLAATMYVSDRPLGGVRTGDVDADGDLDGIAFTGQGDDIDVLYRRDDNSALGTGFLRFRVDSRGAVTNLVVADFDGNEVDDIAYTERLLGGDRLMLAYGTRDRVLDPTEAGAFLMVVGLVPMQAKDSTDPNNVIDDLVILDVEIDAEMGVPLDQTPPEFTLLHGSPQRTMLSFFDPRKDTERDSAFTGVVSYFKDAAQKNANLGNLLAVEILRTGASLVWPVANELGVLTSSPARSVAVLADCRRTGFSTDVDRFCTDKATYLPWWVGTRDLVIAIQRNGPNRMMIVDPAGGTLAPITVFDGPAYLSMAVRAMHAVDTDGDLANELVISFGVQADEPAAPASDDAPTATVLVCDVNGATATPTACSDLVLVTPELEGWTCGDATPARVTPFEHFGAPPPPGAPLAVACRRGSTSTVFRVQRDDTGFHAAAMWTDPDAGVIERIKVGDVTGDGLEELLLIKTKDPDPSKFLMIVPQCASSDLRCISGPDQAAPAMGAP